MITLIGDGLIVLCATLAACCVVAYQVTTGGQWKTSEYGRHLMAFTASVAGVLSLGAVRIIAVDVFEAVDPAWFQWLRLVVFATLPAVLAWRLWLIVAASSEGVAFARGLRAWHLPRKDS